MSALKGIPAANYANLLTKNGYFFQDTTTYEVSVFSNKKNSPPKGYQALDFRDIVHTAINLKGKLCYAPYEQKLDAKIKHMLVNKEANLKEFCCLVQFVLRIYDCFVNYFRGYGYKTTIELAQGLAKDLYHPAPIAITPQPKPDIPPVEKPPVPTQPPLTPAPPPEQPKAEELPPAPTLAVSVQVTKPAPLIQTSESTPPVLPTLKPKAKVPLLKVNSSLAASIPKPMGIERLEGQVPKKQRDDWMALLKGVHSTNFIKLMSLFKGVTTLKQPDHSVGITSVERLLAFAKPGDAFDLKDKYSLTAIEGVIRYCTNNLTTDMVLWFKQFESYSIETFKTCVGTLLEKAQTKAISVYTLEVLLQHYQQNGWYVTTSVNEPPKSEEQEKISVNDPMIVDSVLLLFSEEPDKDSKTAFLTWMGDYMKYPTFKILMQIFINKAYVNGGKNMKYYSEEALMSIYKKHPEWEINVHAEDSDLKKYLYP